MGMGNPSAEVLGYLIKYTQAPLDNWLNQLIEHAVKYLIHDCRLQEMHELQCYLRLEPYLPAEYQGEIRSKLDQFISNCVRFKKDQGEGCFLHPLKNAASPSSRYYPRFADRISEELEMLIKEQKEDGTWHPNWGWDKYEEEWKTAEKELKGLITVENLFILKNYGCIDVPHQ